MRSAVRSIAGARAVNVRWCRRGKRRAASRSCALRTQDVRSASVAMSRPKPQVMLGWSLMMAPPIVSCPPSQRDAYAHPRLVRIAVLHPEHTAQSTDPLGKGTRLERCITVGPPRIGTRQPEALPIPRQLQPCPGGTGMAPHSACVLGRSSAGRRSRRAGCTRPRAQEERPGRQQASQRSGRGNWEATGMLRRGSAGECLPVPTLSGVFEADQTYLQRWVRASEEVLESAL